MFENLSGNFVWEIIANEEIKSLDEKNNPVIVEGQYRGATERYFGIWSDLLREYFISIQDLFESGDVRKVPELVDVLLAQINPDSIPFVPPFEIKQHLAEEMLFAWRHKGVFFMVHWIISKFFRNDVTGEGWELDTLFSFSEKLFYLNSLSSVTSAGVPDDSLKKIYDRENMGGSGRSITQIDVKFDPLFDTKRDVFEAIMFRWMDIYDLRYINTPGA